MRKGKVGIWQKRNGWKWDSSAPHHRNWNGLSSRGIGQRIRIFCRRPGANCCLRVQNRFSGAKKKSQYLPVPAAAASHCCFFFLADDHTGTTTETCPSFIHIVRCNKVRLRYVELSKVSSTTRRIIHLRKLITSIKCEIMIKFVQIARKI
jgi:hypothetical protein